jgi:transcription elongation factor GreB
MSKAFTREGDGDDDDLDVDSEKPLPSGKNYITPAGAKKLRDELHDLLNKQRPAITEIVSWAASLGDRSENADYHYNKKKLREIDRRIRFLSKRLETAEIVDPCQVKSEQVHFGATVTIKNEKEELKTYSIVGVDETDIKRGRISWISPLGSALLKGKKGDIVTFRFPKGEEDLEIVEIRYVSLED